MQLVRYPISGSYIQELPFAQKRLASILRCASREFKGDFQCTPEIINEIFIKLGSIVATKEQLYNQPSAKEIISFLKNANKSAAKLNICFSLSNEGVVDLTPAQWDGIGLLIKTLAEDPNYATPENAHEFLNDLDRQISILSHALEVATVLCGSLHGGKGGRLPLLWYDDFTKTVVEICKRNNLSTKLARDRIDQTPTGQFFRVAELLEKMLPIDMRSKFAETRFDRLETSLRRLKEVSKKPSSEKKSGLSPCDE